MHNMDIKGSLVGADVVLKERNQVEILTSGISMRPMLREHRDIVIVERLCRPLKVNDVPLYRRKGCDKLVLHRIVKLKKDGSMVIRGDNLLDNEYDVKPEDIVGVLKAFYREGKYYDCEKSIKYKLYIFYNRSTFWCRLLWRKHLLPTLGKCTLLRKIKRAIFPKK